jgi:hypothetical protein
VSAEASCAVQIKKPPDTREGVEGALVIAERRRAGVFEITAANHVPHADRASSLPE